MQLLLIGEKVLLKLLVLQQEGHHGEKRGPAPSRALAWGAVLLQQFGVFVIDAGKKAPGGGIVHHQVVGIRPCGGLVLRHEGFGGNTPHGSGLSGPAAAKGVYRLDHRAHKVASVPP